MSVLVDLGDAWIKAHAKKCSSQQKPQTGKLTAGFDDSTYASGSYEVRRITCRGCKEHWDQSSGPAHPGCQLATASDSPPLYVRAMSESLERFSFRFAAVRTQDVQLGQLVEDYYVDQAVAVAVAHEFNTGSGLRETPTEMRAAKQYDINDNRHPWAVALVRYTDLPSHELPPWEDKTLTKDLARVLAVVFAVDEEEIHRVLRVGKVDLGGTIFDDSHPQITLRAVLKYAHIAALRRFVVALKLTEKAVVDLQAGLQEPDSPSR